MLITNEAAWLENLIDFAEHNRKQFAEWLKDFGHKRSTDYANQTISGMKNFLDSQKRSHFFLSQTNKKP